jgi:hypothetical protein
MVGECTLQFSQILTTFRRGENTRYIKSAAGVAPLTWEDRVAHNKADNKLHGDERERYVE